MSYYCSNDVEISVILPVYNCEQFLLNSVESILNQSFSNFELIIINDGSTDSSGNIIRTLLKKDSRIRLIERENKGLISSLNEGIARSSGRYIARMDADDISMPNRLALQYSRLNRDPDIAVLGSAVRIINKNGDLLSVQCHLITPKEIKKFAAEDCHIIHPTVMARKEVIEKVGAYRSAFQHCEDYDLWLRIIDEGYKIENMPEILLSYRIHQSNVTKIHQEQQRLNSVIARLSHRMRVAGLSDPFLTTKKIDSTAFDLYPEQVKKDIKSLLFIVEHTDISSKTKSDIKSAWLAYNRLPDRKIAEYELSRFLMRLMYGAIKNKQYCLALIILREAVSTDPFSLIARLYIKSKIFFRVKFAQLISYF